MGIAVSLEFWQCVAHLWGWHLTQVRDGTVLQDVTSVASSKSMFMVGESVKGYSLTVQTASHPGNAFTLASGGESDMQGISLWSYLLLHPSFTSCYQLLSKNQNLGLWHLLGTDVPLLRAKLCSSDEIEAVLGRV